MADSRLMRALAALGKMLTRFRSKDRRRPDPEPQDPYAYVTAPKKPRYPSRSGAAVAELPEDR